MWDPFIQYLKDPSLVVKVQHFFGVVYPARARDQSPPRPLEPPSETQHEHEQLCHRRAASDISNSSRASDDTESSEDADEPECIVGNRFWYYLFVLGTALGDEIFYATFIPFWFWNVDGAVGRRVVLVWTIIMYIGQGTKDILRWPRPGYPVRKLQTKWAIEYGMPSTHAMVGVSIPFSVLLYTMHRYEYPAQWGLLVACAWCALICVSRLYLGMHSVLDIAAGLVLSVALMLVLVPVVDRLDGPLLTAPWSPALVLAVSVLVIVYYPNADKWTPTRGDTTMIISVCAGLLVGAWTNYQLGNLEASPQVPPYPIIWPSVEMLGLTMLRTVLGFCGVLATRAAAKSFSYAFVCALLGRDKNQLRHSENTLQNKDKIIVELSYKYFTYGMIGFNTTYVFPNVFSLLQINRPTYYTEI